MKKRFAEFVTLQRGFDLPKVDMREGPFPVVGSTSIIGYHDEYKAEPPGVVTGRSGSLGTVQLIREPYWPHNTSLWVKDFKGNDPRFVYYSLKSLDLARFNAGAGVPTLNRNHLDTLESNVPQLPVQQRIADILSAYDDLIENSQRRIKILESMACALHREWFIHFRFPGHENHQRVASPLGEIPKGWTVKSLNSVCWSIEDGDWIETKDQGGDAYRLLQISNVGVGEFVETDNLRFITQETFERLRCNEIAPGDILVARMPTPIGRAWLATRMPWRMITAVDVAIVRTRPELLHPLFLTLAWNDTANLKRIAARASGTTRPRVTRRELATLDFVVPPAELQSRFVTLVAPQMEMVQTMRRQIQNLRRTRDLLLPRLLSGQIDVGAA